MIRITTTASTAMTTRTKRGSEGISFPLCYVQM
jgi:hypothetical protein